MQDKRKAGNMSHVFPIWQLYDLCFDISVNQKQEYEYVDISTDISKWNKQKYCGVSTNKYTW